MDFSAYLAGAGLGASLILAIGAQNALVLTLGLRRHYPLMAALICALSDALLILAGVAGLGTLIAASPFLRHGAAIGGALFLLAYAAVAFHRAARPGHLEADAEVRPARLGVALQVLAVTWLNPHVYIDTVVLLGGISATYAPEARPAFAAGAASASLVWFFALALGAAALAPRLKSPMTWRVIDAATGIVMLIVAMSLIRPYLAEL
ncbi:MAG: LysE family transporter [Hyphomicrobiaceae bacterium]|nr:LysE family transporter [Hyphomicrobiaceae bacterium]